MELKMPTAEQAHWGLRAMKTVALADGALDDAERQMLTSVQTILETNHAVKEIWKNEGVRGLFKFVRGMLGRYEDAALARRYQSRPPHQLVRSTA